MFFALFFAIFFLVWGGGIQSMQHNFIVSLDKFQFFSEIKSVMQIFDGNSFHDFRKKTLTCLTGRWEQS